MIGARRLQTLQELASRSRNARDVKAVCIQAAETLSRNPVDVPFSATYLYSEDRTRAERITEPVWPPRAPNSLRAVSLNGDASNAIASAAATGRIREVGPQSGQPWPYSVDSMLVLPLVSAAHSTAAGFLVAGVNRRKRLDREYRTFFELAAGQIAAAIAEARAYEDERKRAEALAELDRAKTHFFSNVSHELRTPLTLILAPLEDALAEAGPHSREQLELIHRNALRLLRLVNTLLDFTRIEAGRARARYRAHRPRPAHFRCGRTLPVRDREERAAVTPSIARRSISLPGWIARCGRRFFSISFPTLSNSPCREKSE